MRRLVGFPSTVNIVLILIAVAAAVLAIAAVSGGSDPGPEQPIPFSHHLHATEKQINCFFCHPYTGDSSNAGVPPVEKCLLCHNVVAPNFSPIAKIHAYDRRHEGIPWVKVNQLPNYVHFNHRCHIASGHDCSECHGNVKAMDRIKQVHDLDMDLCVSCHRKNKASVDCYTCHY